MIETVTAQGTVATDPRHVTTAEGLPITSFRLAVNQRRFDRQANEWRDAGTDWYTVSTFRTLAVNVAASVHKGDPVLVAGRLHVREWNSGEKTGMTVEIDADSVGHDLLRGTALFSRPTPKPAAEATGGFTPPADASVGWATAPVPAVADGTSDARAQEGTVQSAPV